MEERWSLIPARWSSGGSHVGPAEHANTFQTSRKVQTKPRWKKLKQQSLILPAPVGVAVSERRWGGMGQEDESSTSAPTRSKHVTRRALRFPVPTGVWETLHRSAVPYWDHDGSPVHLFYRPEPRDVADCKRYDGRSVSAG